jgi:hypothetical protein
MRNTLKIVFVLLLFILACKENEQRKPYVAKVGDSFLTVETVEESVGSPFDTSDARIQLFVDRWIEKELLYRAADNKGYTKSDALEKQVVEIRKQLSVQSYLDKEIYNLDDKVTEESLKEYYSQHSKEFSVNDDAVRINLAVFSNRESGNEFRALLLRGKNWSDAYDMFVKGQANAKSIQSNLISVVYSQLTLYPPELWKVSQSLQRNEASFPVKAGELYYLIQLLEKLPKGSTANYETLKDEVRSRFIIERRRMKYERLLENLRKEYKVEVNLKGIENNQPQSK